MSEKLNIHFDMETSDPDDIFALCILSNHPKVNLTSVSITPGSKDQIGLIKKLFSKLGINVPVGSKNKDHNKSCVSKFYYNWLGSIKSTEPDDTGANVILNSHKSYPNLIVVCGAALGNIANFLNLADQKIEKVVIQGGFAGDNVVPEQHVLPKFKGKITCPTFNLNGDVKAAQTVLQSYKINQRYNVSKNVCHGVIYDQGMQEWVRPYRWKNSGTSLLFDGMDFYLKTHKTGKAFHDPLAACVAIDPSICQFEEVELYRERGEWGSRKSNRHNTLISVSVDMEKFKNVMVGND